MVTTHKIKFTIIQKNKRTLLCKCLGELLQILATQNALVSFFMESARHSKVFFFKNNSIHKLCISTSSNILLLDTELCAPKSETNLKLGILKLGTLYQPIKNFWLSYIKTFNIYIQYFLYLNSHIAYQNLSTRMLQTSKL